MDRRSSTCWTCLTSCAGTRQESARLAIPPFRKFGYPSTVTSEFADMQPFFNAVEDNGRRSRKHLVRGARSCHTLSKPSLVWRERLWLGARKSHEHDELEGRGSLRAVRQILTFSCCTSLGCPTMPRARLYSSAWAWALVFFASCTAA